MAVALRLLQDACVTVNLNLNDFSVRIHHAKLLKKPSLPPAEMDKHHNHRVCKARNSARACQGTSNISLTFQLPSSPSPYSLQISAKPLGAIIPKAQASAMSMWSNQMCHIRGLPMRSVDKPGSKEVIVDFRGGAISRKTTDQVEVVAPKARKSMVNLRYDPIFASKQARRNIRGH